MTELTEGDRHFKFEPKVWLVLRKKYNFSDCVDRLKITLVAVRGEHFNSHAC